MFRKTAESLVVVVVFGVMAVGGDRAGFAQSPRRWKVHDMNRPRPPIVTPAKQPLPVAPPSDAIILFDGTDLSQWRSRGGGPAKWTVKDDYMEAAPESGSIMTAQPFGDVQLHVEWSVPPPEAGGGQELGNSGVFLMDLYEIQVLDSYQNETYADGLAASIYGQYPPLFNASLPPGQWQSFDIFFRRPRFTEEGDLEQPARITLIHNGVLVQDNVEIWGPTMWLQHLPYQPHPDKLPLSLQEHGSPVRYRNIWLRELPEWKEPGPQNMPSEPAVVLAPKVLGRYVGRYELAYGGAYTITRVGDQLKANFYGPAFLDLVPHSAREFSLRWTAGRIVFDLNDAGQPVGLTFHIGGERFPAKKVE